MGTAGELNPKYRAEPGTPEAQKASIINLSSCCIDRRTAVGALFGRKRIVTRAMPTISDHVLKKRLR
jgi:hypothetical protein